MAFIGFCMVSPWFFHGVSLVFAWLFVVFHGLLHGFPCFFSLVVACFFIVVPPFSLVLVVFS